MLHPQNLLSHQRFSLRMALLGLKPAAILAGHRASPLDTSLARSVRQLSILGRSGISGRQRESPYQKRLRAKTIWSHSMTKSKLLVLAVILSAAIATPVLAAGETTTTPWSAPVGHRQPRAADVSASTSESKQTLDQEDANVDRKISNVCRGC
jgi:hypothetical protein